MVVYEFPPVEQATAEGLLAVGGDLEVETLVRAYSQGIFPWPAGEDVPLLWFAPPERAVIDLPGLHLSRSLRRTLRRGTFEVTLDRAFGDVMRGCAEVHGGGRGARRRGPADPGGTWITDDMIAAYVRLHRAGHAHSVETWRDGRLVGGVYAVTIGRAVACESMFHRESDASKVALAHLAAHVHAHGAGWLDAQVINDFTASIGAREIPRAAFTRRLRAAVAAPEPDWTGLAGDPLGLPDRPDADRGSLEKP